MPQRFERTADGCARGIKLRAVHKSALVVTPSKSKERGSISYYDWRLLARSVSMVLAVMALATLHTATYSGTITSSTTTIRAILSCNHNPRIFFLHEASAAQLLLLPLLQQCCIPY